MEISEIEHKLINTYCKSEISGGLVIGKWIRKVEDPFLIEKLMWHCEQEFNHGNQWVALLKKFNLEPFPTHSRFGMKSYFHYSNKIKNEIDLLCFVHAYEKRVPFHLTCHSEKSTTNEETRSTINSLIKDEVGHLSWIRDYLTSSEHKGKNVEKRFKYFSKLESDYYHRNLSFFLKSSDPELNELGKIITKNMAFYNSNLEI